MSKRKHRFLRYVRWILWTTGILIVVGIIMVIGLIEYAYLSGLSRLPRLPEAPKLAMPPIVEQLIWSELECDEIEVDRAGALETTARYFWHLIRRDRIPMCSVVKGDHLAFRCARVIVDWDRHDKYAMVSLSIWMRKNWSVAELISCAAGSVIHDDAWYYFHSMIEDLPAAQQVVVTVLSLHPDHRRLSPEKLLEGRNFHIKRLAKNGWISPEYCELLLSEPLGIVEKCVSDVEGPQ